LSSQAGYGTELFDQTQKVGELRKVRFIADLKKFGRGNETKQMIGIALI
jgi:hypothetical protein